MGHYGRSVFAPARGRARRPTACHCTLYAKAVHKDGRETRLQRDWVLLYPSGALATAQGWTSLMALGDLTKQLASQAIRNAVNPPAAPPRPANPGTAMLAQVQAMQKALKEDEELIVLFHAGGATVLVNEFFFPSWQVAVLTGIDTGIDNDKAVTRVISPVESLQLVCKVAKAPPGATPARIKFVTPREPARDH
jgi:hypothetical protein